MDICRYESFKRFSEMLYFKELTLISPKKWSDKYENYLLQIITRDDTAGIFNNAVKQILNISDLEVNRLIEFAKLVCTDTRCICFSRSIDSEVMWSAYNNNNETIMWKTTDRKIETLNPNFDIRLVKYDLEKKGFKSFIELLSFYKDKASIKNAFELFIHKRKMFSYENELRVIDIAKKGDNDTRQYCIPCISEFIDGVMVHPLANERYVSLIKQMCGSFDIKFLGKSSIYDFSQVY